MSELIVLCPTRGRPSAAVEAHRSFVSTRALATTELVFLIDDDDPEVEGYLDITEEGFRSVIQPSPGDMVKALNAGAEWALASGAHYLGFIGDDHRFRTDRWDQHFERTLKERGGGMVYANDGNRVDGDIPTQIVMSAEIVAALGWMGLPTCRHLYIDNVWRVIGDEVAALFYMPDVMIEHLHPAFGKAGWDEGHLRVNSSEMYGHDAQAFTDWINTAAAADIAKVREALGK